MSKGIFSKWLILALLIGTFACQSNQEGASDSNSQPAENQELANDPIKTEIERAQTSLQELEARLADPELPEDQKSMVEKAIQYQKDKLKRFENLSPEDQKAFREAAQKAASEK